MMDQAIEKIKRGAGNNAALQAIGNYLIAFMQNEPAFAEKVMDEKKTIADMMKYIISEAKKQATGGYACCTDETVFGWAVHYFDEKDLKFRPVKALVTSSDSHDKQKKEIVVKKETQPEKPKKAKKNEDMMMSIFDFKGRSRASLS